MSDRTHSITPARPEQETGATLRAVIGAAIAAYLRDDSPRDDRSSNWAAANRAQAAPDTGAGRVGMRRWSEVERPW